MKTKITVKRINDPDVNVEINSAESRIQEIKNEIADCSPIEDSRDKVEVMEMSDE